MKIRNKLIYDVTQYNKRGDHRWEYVWSNSIPIIDELPGEENRFPTTGRLASLDECDPKNYQYSVYANENQTGTESGKDFFYVNLTDWICERDGKVVGVITNEQFKERFEVIEE